MPTCFSTEVDAFVLTKRFGFGRADTTLAGGGDVNGRPRTSTTHNPQYITHNTQQHTTHTTLTHSLTHSLTHARTHSLPPSLPHSLTHSLTIIITITIIIIIIIIIIILCQRCLPATGHAERGHKMCGCARKSAEQYFGQRKYGEHTIALIEGSAIKDLVGSATTSGKKPSEPGGTRRRRVKHVVRPSVQHTPLDPTKNFRGTYLVSFWPSVTSMVSTLSF